MEDVLYGFYFYLIFGALFACLLSNYIIRTLRQVKREYIDIEHELTDEDIRYKFGALVNSIGIKRALGIIFSLVTLFWLPACIFIILNALIVHMKKV